jgi:hypothetical protein
MSELDSLPEQFERLLGGIGTGNSLEEWRYAYRKVVYSGAMRILKEFPEIIIGPPPPPPQLQRQPGPGPAPGGNPQIGGGNRPPYSTAGQQPPYRPNAIHELLCIALGTCQQN